MQRSMTDTGDPVQADYNSVVFPEFF